MKHNYEQLIRTKKYRKLKVLYGRVCRIRQMKTQKKNAKDIGKQMSQMQEDYNVTWDYCRTSMIPIKDKYGIDSVFALTKAEDIWRAVEKCLFSDGETIHFAKWGDLPCIRAKQNNRGIVIKSKQMNLSLPHSE